MALKRDRDAFEKDRNSHAPFVSYGTALPPLDPEIRDDGSFVPVWKQEVRDERGRKRLHGAFTGGFSAGYFNTVGSKEGWTPSTFKSSRAERAKAKEARPEDFMDEEDLKEAAEAKLLETARGFTALGGDAAEDGDGSTAPTLMDLLMPPPSESMGVKLLKKMGWKEGQGVGPKVKRKARTEDVDMEGRDEEKEYFFAPANTKVVTFSKKTDTRGLGYTGEPSLREAEEEMKKELAKSKSSKPKKAPSKTAFGVGILNDDDEDEDPYEIKPMSLYNKTIGGKEKKKKEKTVKKPALHTFVKKGKTLASDVRKCHDGRLPLEGFVLASEPLIQDKWYAPPEVPVDWKPSVSEGLDSEDAKPHLSMKEVAQASTLDPASRAAILGEEALPGKSIFDFLTPAARAKLVAATGRTDLPPALGEKPDAPPDPLLARIPHIDPTTARSALNGFMPYQDDLEKRSRYRRYLEIEAGIISGPIERAPGMSTDDFLSELSEFKNSARIFKPLPATMASRFTSSVSHTSQIATNTSEIQDSDDPDTFIHRPSEQNKKPEDPAEAAAKLNMYGHLTRSVEGWTPNRLLCKRFGVSFPKPFDFEGSSSSRSRAKREWEEELSSKDSRGPEAPQPARGPDPAVRVPKQLVSDADILAIMRDVKGDENYQLPEKEKREKVNVEVNTALEAERAGEEVFKAIFGDSDDEED
ncbi:DUF1604-domain-containing protein [Ascobolus immersus RN42]|uniref:DUF1604-domain-containing protein n=1 Tax=Ascobolus immersus RN42 TaxID=1160509 RepID=A0A3N4HVV4_ASCIM|nr:DUF1604-domain-containing protein [Ascobolus immersus RN42]